MPPPLLPGPFDAHPKAHRLHDGREVSFAGAGESSSQIVSAIIGNPPFEHAKDAANHNPSAESGKPPLGHAEDSSNRDASSNSGKPPLGYAKGVVLHDPVDFDVSRKGVSERWEGGTAVAVEEENRVLAAAISAEGRLEKERSLCGHCRRRFAGVSCVECRQAYCFRWAIDVLNVFLPLENTNSIILPVCSGNLGWSPTGLKHVLVTGGRDPPPRFAYTVVTWAKRRPSEYLFGA